MEILDTSGLKKRFESKVHFTNDSDGCWEWTGSKDTKGYGQMGVNIADRKRSLTQRAHRVSYFLEHGRMPTDCILHKCDNRPCVRPSHLFEGSQQDNMADAAAKGRMGYVGCRQREKTHCPQGHPYSSENVYNRPHRPGRHCRICKTATWTRWALRQKKVGDS